MESKPFFSIIMPVYRVERYLDVAIKSVLNQTYTDFEFLLIDDNSPDRCPQICDDYALKDNRIRVIHKPENQGLSMALNTGIENVTGEYVLFVDSDDSINRDTLKIVKESLNNETEILTFGMKRVYEDWNGNIIRVDAFRCKAEESHSIKQNGTLFIELTKTNLFPYVCNKVYNSEFLRIHQATFETTKLIEDFLFNIHLFAKARHITLIPNCLYYYRKPPHPTLVTMYSPLFYELIKRKFALELEFLKITDNDYFEARQTVLYSHIKHIVAVFLRNKAKSARLSSKDQKQAIRRIVNDQTTISTLDEFVPKSLMQKALCFILKRRMVVVCYCVITCANFIKKR